MAGSRLQSSNVFSPLASTLLDRFSEGVVLFDPDGHLRYANEAGRRVLDALSGENGLSTSTLLQRLGRLGGRIERLSAGPVMMGHAVYLPGYHQSSHTLAEQERRAIVDALEDTGWRLTETARRLGISRTTLWRRLREYGMERDRNGEPHPAPGDDAAEGRGGAPEP
jgi:lambda repressor-like predicted transcriptional regulator